MGSLDCCTSRQPPSPDGLPARPYCGPIRPQEERSRDNLPLVSWSTVSRFSKPEDAAELQAIFDDIKADSDEEDEETKAKKSSSTLDAVKAKLKKHLSLESGLSKRHSRSSVGTSEEEIERRKELRRLRQIRIQEELSSEGIYDDDAKSLSSFATARMVSVSRIVARPEGNIVSLPLVPVLNNDPTSRIFLDTSPKNLDVVVLPQFVDRETIASLKSPFPVAKQDIAKLRRCCSLDSINFRNTVDNFVDDSPRRQSFEPIVPPPAPMLKPQRLDSITDSVARRTSWRLSFASTRRASQLRALSQEYPSPMGSVTSAGPGVSHLRWLRSQGLHMSSQAITDPSETNSNLEVLPSHSALCVEEKEFGGVDGHVDAIPPPVPLHEMQISRRLCSRDLASPRSSPQLSSCGSREHHRGLSYASRYSRHSNASRYKYLRHTSSSGMGDGRESKIWGISIQDGASSIYLSGENSRTSSPESSRFNLPAVLASMVGRSICQDTDLRQSYVAPHSSETAPIMAEGLPSVTSLRASSSTRTRRLTIDSSLLVSETASFLEREVELNTIKKRFPASLSRNGPPSPIQSKFKEQFEDHQILPGSNTRASILSALHIPGATRLASKSCDGADSIMFLSPSPDHPYGYGYKVLNLGNRASSPSRESPGRKSPINVGPKELPPESTSAKWQRAVKCSADWRTQQVSSKLSLPLIVKKEKSASGLSASSPSPWKLARRSKKTMQLSPETPLVSMENGDALFLDDGKTRQEERRKDRLSSAYMHAWTDLLEAQESISKAKSAGDARGRARRRAATPPASWARFPSHTRAQRTESAGALDRVIAKDFAIKSTKEGVTEWAIGERKHIHHHHAKEKHHSLPMRMTKRLRASLYKLRTAKSIIINDAVHGRKSSTSVGGQLEYPELEVLPLDSDRAETYGEFELEIAETVRQAERASRMMIFNDGASYNGELEDATGVGEISQISIADPSFYDDCLVNQKGARMDDEDMSLRSFISAATLVKHDTPMELDNSTFKREKFKTWSGRGKKVDPHVFHNSALRSSTVDFKRDLEKMERLERERAIRAAEAAFGR